MELNIGKVRIVLIGDGGIKIGILLNPTLAIRKLLLQPKALCISKIRQDLTNDLIILMDYIQSLLLSLLILLETSNQIRHKLAVDLSSGGSEVNTMLAMYELLDQINVEIPLKQKERS